MNVMKSDLRKKMRDDLMDDSLVVYIEREIFATLLKYANSLDIVVSSQLHASHV